MVDPALSTKPFCQCCTDVSNNDLYLSNTLNVMVLPTLHHYKPNIVLFAERPLAAPLRVIKTGVKETNKNGLLYISTEVHIACSVVIVSYWTELCLVVDKVDGVS